MRLYYFFNLKQNFFKMKNEKIEIKLETRSTFFFNMIKKYLISILKFIFSILILAGTLYISFYILLFLIIIITASYLFNRLKS